MMLLLFSLMVGTEPILHFFKGSAEQSEVSPPAAAFKYKNYGLMASTHGEFFLSLEGYLVTRDNRWSLYVQGETDIFYEDDVVLVLHTKSEWGSLIEGFTNIYRIVNRADGEVTFKMGSSWLSEKAVDEGYFYFGVEKDQLWRTPLVP